MVKKWKCIIHIFAFSDIKIMRMLEGSKSLKIKVLVWISLTVRGIGEILKYAHAGIKEYQKIRDGKNISS